MNLRRLVQALREEQQRLENNAVMYPSGDPLKTGVNAGQWQGIEFALAAIKAEEKADDDADEAQTR